MSHPAAATPHIAAAQPLRLPLVLALVGLLLAPSAWAQSAGPPGAATPSAEPAQATTKSVDAEMEAAAESAPRVADDATRTKLEGDPRFTRPPATLDATAHDLILLNSGEWLQGDINGIRDDTIDFDSVELEDIEIDLDDVKEIHANRVHTYRFEGDRDILTGPLRMNEEIFVVDGNERPRAIFMSQIPGKPREWNYWNGDFFAGYTIRSGNTNQSDLTLRAELNRETALTRLNNVYNGAISTAEDDAGSDQRTANSHRLNSSFDYFVSNRVYVIVPAVEVFADEFQNIDVRVTPSAGVGWEWLKRKYVTWDVSAQGGYQYLAFVTAPAGEDTRSNDGVVVLSTKIETDPTSDVEWDTSYKVQVVPANIDQTNHHLESILSVDLFLGFDLDVTFIWDRIEGPEPEVIDAGPPEVTSTPEQNDYRLTFGLGWDF